MTDETFVNEDQQEEEDLVCLYAPNRFCEVEHKFEKHVWLSLQAVFAEWPENLAA